MAGFAVRATRGLSVEVRANPAICSTRGPQGRGAVDVKSGGAEGKEAEGALDQRRETLLGEVGHDPTGLDERNVA